MGELVGIRLSKEQAEDLRRYMEEHGLTNKSEALRRWMVERAGSSVVNRPADVEQKVAEEISSDMAGVITKATEKVINRGLEQDKREMEALRDEIKSEVAQLREGKQPIIVQPPPPVEDEFSRAVKQVAAESLKKDLTRSKGDEIAEITKAIEVMKKLDLGNIKIDGQAIASMAETAETYLRGRNENERIRMIALLRTQEFNQLVFLIERIEKMKLDPKAKAEILSPLLMAFSAGMKRIQDELGMKTEE